MLIIHDNRLPREYLDAIGQKSPQAEFCPFGGPEQGWPRPYDSIFCHPDIYFFQIDKRVLVHAPSVSEAFLSSLKQQGIKLIKGERSPSGSYPETALYNAALVGDTVFHNTGLTDRILADKALEFELDIIDVPQGYSACSVVPAGEKAMITSDGGIAAEALENGIETLLVSSGGVMLPGERRGFLGGASGRTASGDIVFLGDIARHPDHRAIVSFAEKHGVKIISLEGLPLYDAGKIIIFE